MVNILVVDTLGVETSVVQIVNERLFSTSRQTTKHADTFGECLRSVTQMSRSHFHEIDLIVANVGPGSFTGLRVGIASIQAIAWAHNISVWPVSNLCGLAYQAHWSSVISKDIVQKNLSEIDVGTLAWPEMEYSVAIDARMQEAYTGMYFSNGAFLQPLCKENIAKIEGLSKDNVENRIYVGDVWSKPPCTSQFTWAEVMAMVAYYGYKDHVVSVSVEELRPSYLRNKVTN